MDPIVRRALERGITAFLLTFVLGSGVVLAVGSIGGDGGAGASASPDPSASPGGGLAPVAETPRAYLVWVPGGFPETFAEELTTIGAVKRAVVATAGVAWLTRSTDADGDIVDDPDPPYMVPLEVTGTDPQAFASFLPSGEGRDLLAGLEPGQAILSTSSAKLRGLGVGATLTVDPGLDLEVVGTLPDVLMGAYEVLVPRLTAERIGAGLPRYALLRLRAGADPPVAKLTEDLLELFGRQVRDPAVEVRRPGDVEFLRAHDRSAPPIVLKHRFGEFTAYPDPSERDTLNIDQAWIEDELDLRELPRLGAVECHRKMLQQLKKAMADLTSEASLGDIGPCFDDTWAPDLPQGTLPAALWGAAIRVNIALNQPGNPPLLDARVKETMTAWGFRWAGEDAYPDGALFEFLEVVPRGGAASPAPDEG